MTLYSRCSTCGHKSREGGDDAESGIRSIYTKWTSRVYQQTDANVVYATPSPHSVRVIQTSIDDDDDGGEMKMTQNIGYASQTSLNQTYTSTQTESDASIV